MRAIENWNGMVGVAQSKLRLPHKPCRVTGLSRRGATPVDQDLIF